MMNSIAATSMSMANMQLEQGLSIAMAKKTMDTQEAMATSIFQDMMPQQPAAAPSDAMFIDVYA